MLLVDTGINTTPAEVILPWFEASGFDIAELDGVLISHAGTGLSLIPGARPLSPPG